MCTLLKKTRARLHPYITMKFMRMSEIKYFCNSTINYMKKKIAVNNVSVNDISRLLLRKF